MDKISDRIDMDHTVVSGFEQSSVILRQAKYYRRLKWDAKHCQMFNQVEGKMDDLNTDGITFFLQFSSTFLMP